MKLKGLTTKKAQEKYKKYGANEIVDVNKVSWYTILLRQVKGNFVVYLLLVATILSFIVRKSVTAYAVLSVIILVVGVGFIQEYKAEKAVESLKKMITPTTLVIRNSKEQEIPSTEIVPGDILILRTGEKIPADSVILEQTQLLVNEAVLTGESKEVKKQAIKDQTNTKEENILYMGSFIVNGKTLAKVTHTGMNTKFGKIADMISTAEKELPLQIKINKTLKLLVFFGLFFAFLTGVVVLLKEPIITTSVIADVLILVIAISVASFPEGLPVVLISSLSMGAYRMAKRNAIVNRMSIIETLGETTVICSDKTGTITKGEMTVKKIYANNQMYDVSGVGYERKGQIIKDNKPAEINKELSLILKASVLCNDTYVKELENNIFFEISGPPTEAALLVLASKANIFKEDFEVTRKEEIPFSSEKKYMSVLVSEDEEENVYVKGAIEVILKKCKYIFDKGKIRNITQKDIDYVLSLNKKLTNKALRTLAFAYKKYDQKDINNHLVFVGFVGLEDPPREEVKKTLLMCAKAGIKVKMITGDAKETAKAIAKKIGLKEGKILEGKEIDNLTDDELSKIINDVVVFARVRPEHKLRIVKALKQNKEIVTMTGDGVNDAPALKEAHVGVAMGQTGTDVSRSVADLTLKDDNFASIVYAIKEGRTIFTNIRKFMTYQFSCNFSQLGIIVFGVLLAGAFGWPIPLLLPLQILFMNIVTDNLPAIALSFNPSSNDIMEGRINTKKILTKNLLYLLFFSGVMMTLFSLGVFYVSFNIYGHDGLFAGTTALLTLIFLQIVGAFVFRSFRKGVLNRSPFINLYLFFASIISIVATIVVLYTPLNKVFETTPLPFVSWILVLGLGLLYVLIFDILKIINKKTNFWSVDEKTKNI